MHALFVWIALLSVPSDPSSLRQAFDAEAPQGWQRWARQFKNVDARYHQQMFVLGDDGQQHVQEDRTLEYFYNGNMRRRHLYATQANGSTLEEIAVRRGDDYLFYAERRNSEPFVITDMEHGPPQDAERDTPPPFQAPYSVQYADLNRLLSNPRFTIKSLTQTKRPDGKEVVRLTFDYRYSGDRTARFQSGYVDFLPESGWAVLAYRVKTPDDFYISGSIEYGPRFGDFQPITKITIDYLDKEGRALQGQSVITFERCEHRDIPQDFFSLAAVGLPEIGPPQRQSRWFVLILTGTLLLLLSVVMYFRMRKREGA